MAVQRKKWWEVAITRDQIDLFNLLARNPKYNWRSIESVLKGLGWDPEKFQKIISPFLSNRIILIRKDEKKGIPMIGYWERVDDVDRECKYCENKDGCDECRGDEDYLEEYNSDPNII